MCSYLMCDDDTISIFPRRCHGKGTWIKMPCGHCRGVGQVKTKQKVMVPVPAGIEDGQTVRMPVGKKEVKCSSYIADTLGSYKIFDEYF